MQARLVLLPLCLLFLLPSLSGAVSPSGATVSGPTERDLEGRRAFADLGRYYAAQDSLPAYRAALDALASPRAAERQAAGRYLLRLLQQSLADETNGRAEWMQTPYWGGGLSSRAHEFRESVADAIGDRATGAEALPALDWLLLHDPDFKIQRSGARALSRVGGPAAVELLGRLMRGPHPNGSVLIEAIRAARSGSVVTLIPELRRLAGDYRESVRQAAGEALVAMGAGPSPSWRPTAAFPDWLAEELRVCAARVWTPIPRNARWCAFDIERRTTAGRTSTQRIRGWLLAKEDTTYRVLDEFGEEEHLSRTNTSLVSQTLAAEASRIAALRQDPTLGGRDVADSLSRDGGLTAQFECRDLSLPEILIAAWCFERGDTASAATVLFPRIDALGDEREFDRIARDLLGNTYHRRMLEAFSYDRDYARTMALAEHLSRPLFDGYAYQPRARELRAQLARRQSDFHEFALPDSAAWLRLRRTMDRRHQIAYLVERLRLLNCFQWMQPGGPSMNADQYEAATHMSGPWDPIENRSRRLVNPYRELTAMRLTPADVSSLAPALADVRYMPTFGFWRDFDPARDLYRVCDIVAGFVNDVAQQQLVDPDSIPGLTPERREDMVRAIIAWGKAHAQTSPEDLCLEVLKTTQVGWQFRLALREGLDNGDPRVPRILLERFNEFPKEEPFLLEVCSQARTDAFVPLARKMVTASADLADHGWSAMARAFYPALILFRQGDPDGLPAVRRVLAQDDDGYWMRQVYDSLLASGDPKSRDVLCQGAHEPKLLSNQENSAMLRRLFREGCPGVADALIARLSDATPGGAISFEDAKTGARIEGHMVQGDGVALYVSEWRPRGARFTTMAPDEERARGRDELRLWLVEQARRVRAGEAPDMNP